MDEQLHEYEWFTKVNSNSSSNICRKMKLKMYSAGDIVTLTVIFVWKYGTYRYEVTNCYTQNKPAGKERKMFSCIFKIVYTTLLTQLEIQLVSSFS